MTTTAGFTVAHSIHPILEFFLDGFRPYGLNSSLNLINAVVCATAVAFAVNYVVHSVIIFLRSNEMMFEIAAYLTLDGVCEAYPTRLPGLPKAGAFPALLGACDYRSINSPDQGDIWSHPPTPENWEKARKSEYLKTLY
ncbi:hypothetical protein ACJJTC_012937 [Scirpophaga incertulas]